MNTKILRSHLHQLARLYNIQTAYYDVAHLRRPASPESLLAILQALGAPVAAHFITAWRPTGFTGVTPTFTAKNAAKWIA